MSSEPAAAAQLPLTVLVVDDTAINRQIVQVFLKRLGYSVITAEDGAQAVEVFERERPDMVLMDVMMPLMDGYEATRRIKALSGDRWVPVVFLSALDKDENLVAGLDAGGDDYLAKPVNFVVLDAKLRSLRRTLELYRALGEMHRRLQVVSDAMIDGLITADEEANILSANPAAELMFGYGGGELVGQNVRQLMPEPQRGEHDGYVSRYVRGGMPRIIGVGQRDMRGQRRDGRIFPMDLGISEARIGGRRVFVGVMRDTTDRYEAQARERAHLERLSRYHEAQEAENSLAFDLLTRQLKRPGLEDPALHSWLAPAAAVSGDVIAAARDPHGHLYVMLADATGHGLSASISTMPVLSLFYEMVEWGMALPAIIARINDQLRQAIPASRFVAAAFLMVDEKRRQAELWVGGVPSVLLLDAQGRVERRVESSRLPLGIMDADGDFAVVERIDWLPGSQFVLCSDGLIEAADVEGRAFGEARLEETLAKTAAAERIAAVRVALGSFIGDCSPHDDVSLLLVDCRATA